ncbi:MAG: hypothetical protein ACKO2G_16155 [Verrucomicrobiales bacterium]
MFRTTLILLLVSALPAVAAESPADAVAAFLKSLEAGKTTPADNDTVALSPFAPEEKKAKFEEGLTELAEQVKGATPTIEPVAEPKGAFAGFRLILRQKQNPLQVVVRAICVIRTEGGWKVAAGVSNFDNTNFGFEENLEEWSGQVAEAARREAEETGRRLLAEGAASLWKDIRALREKWPKEESAEDLVKRFLKYDRTDDAVGKLACFHITPDLSAASLEQFLTLLSGKIYDLHDAEENAEAKNHGNANAIIPQISLLLGGHEDDGKLCRVMGFMNPRDPSDYYVQAFYLRKGEGARWLLIPDGYEVEGLRSPDSDLVNWFEENETDLGKQFVIKLAEQGRKEAPPSIKREDGAAMTERYLNVMANRKITEAFSFLDFPEQNVVDDFDGLMEALSKECTRLAPTEATVPVILPMRWKEVGDFGGTVHAIFQPESTRPFLLHIQLSRWTKDGWRVLPPPWDDGPESLIHQPDARKLQTELEVGWEEMKTGAIQRLFGETRGKAANNAEPEKVVRELIATAFADAVANRQKEYLAAWKPLKDGQINNVSALEMATRLGKELRGAGKVPETELMLRGDLVGILIPVNQAKREDGQKPARMIIARREDDLWTLVPGLEFFRPINRGFKELNQKALAATSTAFDEAGNSDLKELLSWLEQAPQENKPE